MALKSFCLSGIKGLRFAVCEEVPRVMVIAGPNGVGKSTLLHAISRKDGCVFDGDTTVLYQPPHRAVRRHQVRRGWLSGGFRRFSETLAAPDMGSGFEGISFYFPQRGPDNVDEAGSTLKYTLGKTENRRTTQLARAFDQAKETGTTIDPSMLQDIYEPLTRVVNSLLPHLTLGGVDFSNEENIKVVFQRKDSLGSDTLDLDDLSSGEKSVLLLFLPLVEDEINSRLDNLLGGGNELGVADRPHRLFVVDEPELHLHPDLQAALLSFVRNEALTGTQFLMATQSSTLLDYALDSELFVLRPSTTMGTNQLRRIATSPERLSALKFLAGDASRLTTGKSLVCVEGPSEEDSIDQRLLKLMHPAATRFTLVGVGSKGNVINVVKGMREAGIEDQLDIRILGVVDSDRSESTPEGIVAWPVASVENLLLDADAIIETLDSLKPEHGLVGADVDAILRDVAIGLRDEEVRLRVMAALRPRTIRIKALSVDEVREAVHSETVFLEGLVASCPDIVHMASTQVDAALAEGTFLRTFRGKELLQHVFRRLDLPNISFDEFWQALARNCSAKESVSKQLDEFIAALDSKSRSMESNPASQEVFDAAP